MTRGQNIAMIQPRRLKVNNNNAQLMQSRFLARISRTWMYGGPGVPYNHDLIINKPQAFPIDPRFPVRQK